MRRTFLARAAAGLGALAAGGFAAAQDMVELPFAHGRRQLLAFPEKRPLIVLTARPPQLETPFDVFNDGLITPNDAFFVRYHLAGIPTSVDPDDFRLAVRGRVKRPLSLSLDELRGKFPSREIVAVNQCSGNSRGFFDPRVTGGQLANGAMGNARWRGVPLRLLLDQAGLEGDARQVTFNGLDEPVIPSDADFIKALDLDVARGDDVLVAFEMNGTELPMLNGYPLRLVVPGYYGTYWVKHLFDINVIDQVFDGFWMKTAYRVPDNPCHCVEPGKTPSATVPIGRFDVRSFITSLRTGDQLRVRRTVTVRGIAFDGGAGIRAVRFSDDDGATWSDAHLGEELSRYSFREWTYAYTPSVAGPRNLLCRAESRQGEIQPLEARWNAGGYMRNVVESLPVLVV